MFPTICCGVVNKQQPQPQEQRHDVYTNVNIGKWGRRDNERQKREHPQLIVLFHHSSGFAYFVCVKKRRCKCRSQSFWVEQLSRYNGNRRKKALGVLIHFSCSKPTFACLKNCLTTKHDASLSDVEIRELKLSRISARGR